MVTTSTGGDSNSAFGMFSLKLTTTGDNNTAMGYQAGCTLTTGSNNVMIGNVAGTSTLAIAHTTTQSNRIILGNSNSTNAYIKIDWTIGSDQRDKMNFVQIPHGLDFVNQLNPVEYNFKKSRDEDIPHGNKKYGFKAQEILELEGDNPVIVDNDDTNNLKMTSTHLIPILVNAIKELKARIEELEDK